NPMFHPSAAKPYNSCATSLKAKGKAPNSSTTNDDARHSPLRPLDQWTRIVAYEPSADCQLPMYNAAADQRVTTTERLYDEAFSSTGRPVTAVRLPDALLMH